MLALALLLAACLALPSNAIWPFPPKRFSGNSLLKAGSMGVNDNDRIIAYGDFNGDQFLDLLALGQDQQTLTIYLWNHDKYTFSKATSFQHSQKVYNAVPGDFTQDGKLDILVMSEDRVSNQLGLHVYVGLPEGGFSTDPVAAPASSLSQPIPVDTNGDLKIDLFGTVPSSTLSGPFQVWSNVWNSSVAHSPVFEVTNPKLKGPQCKLSNPHSNAAVDLNGDCLADLFLVCDEDNGSDHYYQIWTNNKANGFELAQTGRFPSGFQSVTFGDIDRDGTIDMLFVTCDSVSRTTGIGIGCKINIAYNKQLPLCSSTTSSPQKGKTACRRPDELCTADPDFRFDFSQSTDNADFVQVPVTDIFPASTGSAQFLLVSDVSQNPATPIPIKLGDVNQDGFPDMVAILASGTGTRSDRTPQLAYSVPCGKNTPGCGSNGRGRRGWSVLQKGGEVLAAIKDARAVAFLDMDEDGSLDFMVQRTGSQGQGNIMFVQNNFYYDAFFLKAIVLNGACGSGICNYPNGSGIYHPFGVSYSGATYKYTVLDTAGGRSAAAVGQLPQTSYQSLLTPYSYFGLGRTNNYIENLFVGSTKHSEEHYINMEGVIPNSKVVIIPSIDADGPWRKELYLRPGEWIPWVTLSVVAATIILAVIVFVLHLNEKRADELERRKASHHINFDAL
ncbi:integrin alpha N-terminal domain-containing protein [Trametopsis cervina]|nr:integrin alpha N-terminal domain-containing protein [Trametopsis cervina]